MFLAHPVGLLLQVLFFPIRILYKVLGPAKMGTWGPVLADIGNLEDHFAFPVNKISVGAAYMSTVIAATMVVVMAKKGWNNNSPNKAV